MSNIRRQKLLYLPIHLVLPGSSRRCCPTPALQELAASIAQVGVLQPLTVRPQGDKYLTLSGNRRLLGARMAGLQEVPCLLMESGCPAGLMTLTENLQREDLHFLEEAALLRQYMEESGLTQGEAARHLGRSQSAIANKLRLLALSPEVQQLLRESGLTERHGRALLALPEDLRLPALREIAARELTVAQTEQYVRLLRTDSFPARLRQRDTRLFLQRVEEDAALLRRDGIPAETSRHQEHDTVVLTVRIPGECGKK